MSTDQGAALSTPSSRKEEAAVGTPWLSPAGGAELRNSRTDAHVKLESSSWRQKLVGAGGMLQGRRTSSWSKHQVPAAETSTFWRGWGEAPPVGRSPGHPRQRL